MTNYKLKITNRKHERGQTLILLLVVIMMIIAITTAATVIIATNSTAASNSTIGQATKQMAESGAERAMLGLLRNPTGYNGETFPLDTGNVTVTINRGANITIDSTAVDGNFTKKVELIATYTSNVLTLVSWKDLN